MMTVALAGQIEQRYGFVVASVVSLDDGAVQLELADGRRWVARIFPAERPLATTEAEAAARGGAARRRCVAPRRRRDAGR